jgi:hypothetical protein
MVLSSSGTGGMNLVSDTSHQAHDSVSKAESCVGQVDKSIRKVDSGHVNHLLQDGLIGSQDI